MKSTNEPKPEASEQALDAFVDGFADWIADLLEEGKLDHLIEQQDQE